MWVCKCVCNFFTCRLSTFPSIHALGQLHTISHLRLHLQSHLVMSTLASTFRTFFFFFVLFGIFFSASVFFFVFVHVSMKCENVKSKCKLVCEEIVSFQSSIFLNPMHKVWDDFGWDSNILPSLGSHTLDISHVSHTSCATLLSTHFE